MDRLIGGRPAGGPFAECRDKHCDDPGLYLRHVAPEPGWFGHDQANGWS